MSETLEKFGKASANNKKSEATTVKTARQPGESVLSCFDLSSFSTTHPVFFVTYKKIPDPDNAKEVKIINETSWQAKVNPDNNTLTNLTLAPGYTDIGNEVGDCVECIPTTFWANSLIDGLNNSLDNNGKIKPEAVPNVTATIKEKSITADKIDFTTMPLAEKVTIKRNDTTTDKPVNVQCGCARILVSANAFEAIANIQFPKQFKSGTFPVVVCTFAGYTPNSGDAWTNTPLDTWGGASMSALKITNSSFKATIRRFDGATLNGVYYFNWIAIGQ
jgi:H-type lectin domain